MVDEILERDREAFEAIARRAVESVLASSPRAFATYSFDVPEDEVVDVVESYGLDVEGLELLKGEVKAMAVEHLRHLEQRGDVVAVTSERCSPAFRDGLRRARHPLLRLMADQEFGCALAGEAAEALQEAAALPGWRSDQPQLVRYAV